MPWVIVAPHSAFLAAPLAGVAVSRPYFKLVVASVACTLFHVDLLIRSAGPRC